MVHAMKKVWADAFEFIAEHVWTHKSQTELHQIGNTDFYADYTPLSREQIEAAKAECADHIARSNVISVKSGL